MQTQISNKEREVSQYACNIAALDDILRKEGYQRLAVSIQGKEGDCGVIVLQQVYEIMKGKAH